ncbi:unnamed protein product [Calypogeia fissa]
MMFVKMGTSQFLKRVLLLLLLVPFVALVFSHSIPWMAYPQLACPFADGEENAELAVPELDIRRSDFPENFVFGSATAAYQVEGAVNEGGKGPSIWDIFAHTPGKIADNANADVTVDQYHRYQEDVDLLKAMNMDAYRFSISWSRIMPDGQGSSLNEEGIAYYNRLIDALLSKGVQPYATLYHWDLPQALQDSYDGWIGKEIVGHFAAYAEVCFSEFGDRVKNWITFNEPAQFTWLGYGEGIHAPGRTSDRILSPAGNTSTEPYLAAHHVLLAHATAVDVYRKKFQATQGGTIGITVDCEWAEPLTDSPDDVEAAERRRLFQLGWFLDPIFFGDYPEVMRAHAGARLPQFSSDEKSLLSRCLDFIGLNHYTTKWVTSTPAPTDPTTSSYWLDQCISTTDLRDGVSIGEKAYSFWLYVVPWGIERLISWTWERYKMPIYITENGMDTLNSQILGEPLPQQYQADAARISFYHDYLTFILSAIRKGADVRCYFAWSLLDNFEWAVGYTSRFGLFYVDYSTLNRYPKDSARWFAEFLHPKDEGPCQQRKLR